MEFKDVLNKRVSVKSFKDKEISDEIILDLLKAGHLAPSAKNKQPWRFKILKGKEKETLGKKLIDIGANIEPDEYMEKFASTISATGNTIIKAPVFVIVYKNTDEIWDKTERMVIGAAVENILLAATDKGLGSLWVNDVLYAYDYLKIDGMDLITSFVLGYPTEDYQRKRIRMPIEEIIIK